MTSGTRVWQSEGTSTGLPGAQRSLDLESSIMWTITVVNMSRYCYLLLHAPIISSINRLYRFNSTEYAQLIVCAEKTKQLPGTAWSPLARLWRRLQGELSIGIFSRMLHAMGRSEFNRSSNFVLFTPQVRHKMRGLLVRAHISELNDIRHLTFFSLTHCSVFLPDGLADMLVPSLCIS